MVRVDEDDEAGDELFDREQVRNYLTFTAGAVRRHRRLMAGVIAAIVGLTALALFALPRTYHVEAKLLAQRNPVLAVRGDGQDAVAPTHGAAETIRRRDNLVALIEATNLLQHWDEHRAPAQRAYDAIHRLLHGAADDQERLDTMVERLEKHLNAWTNEGTVVITIDWPDARMAARLVDVAQQNFLEMRYAQEITALAESISILRSHAANLRGDVDEAVAALEKVREKREGSAAPEGGAGEPAPVRHPVARRASEPRPEIEQVQTLLNAKKKALDDLEERRRQRLAEMQVHLSEQKATYTENHPVVIDLKQTIAALETPSPQIKALREEVASLRAEQEKMAGERGSPGPVTAGAVALSAPPARLPPDILRLDQELREDKDPATIYARGRLRDAMDKYAALCEKAETAQIDIETAQAAFKYRYSILTPAKVPKEPVKPSVLLILLAGLVASVFMSVLVVVATDIRSGRIVERWQIERLLGRPILGEVAIAELPAHRGGDAR